MIFFFFLVNQKSGLHANSLQCILLHIFPCSHKHKLFIIWAHLVFLCFTLLHFADTAFFTNRRFMASLHRASLLAPFFPTAFVHFMCVSASHFGNSHNISNFFIVVTFVMVICDQWSLMSLWSLFWGAVNCAHIKH